MKKREHKLSVPVSEATSSKSKTFFDGHYFVEDCAAAGIYNWLTHQGIYLTEEQVENISRIIMGQIISFIFLSDDYKEFMECRKEKLPNVKPMLKEKEAKKP